MLDYLLAQRSEVIEQAGVGWRFAYHAFHRWTRRPNSALEWTELRDRTSAYGHSQTLTGLGAAQYSRCVVA